MGKFPCQGYPSFEDRKIWVSPTLPWKTRYPGSVYPFAGNRPRAQLCLPQFENTIKIGPQGPFPGLLCHCLLIFTKVPMVEKPIVLRELFLEVTSQGKMSWWEKGIDNYIELRFARKSFGTHCRD